MSDKYHIPQSLDEPFKLILWTLDELALLFVPILFFTFCFNSPLIGICIGAALLIAIKKIKGEQGHYFLFYLLYWHLPTLVRFKKTPPSYIREWIG